MLTTGSNRYLELKIMLPDVMFMSHPKTCQQYNKDDCSLSSFICVYMHHSNQEQWREYSGALKSCLIIVI